MSQLETPFSLAASRALLEEVSHLSAIASYLALSLEFFDFLIISFPELSRLLDAVYSSSWSTIAFVSSVVISLKAVYSN